MLKTELRLDVPPDGELTPLMAKAVVALGHLLREESEEKVWAVIKTHYEVNHNTRVLKLCNNCDGNGTVEGEYERTEACPQCEEGFRD